MKKKILLFTNYFTPSVKGGGPIRSIENLVSKLYNDIEIYIVCLDRDLGDTKPFNSIQTNKWLNKEKYKVYYVSKDKMNLKVMLKLLKSEKFDSIYLNSFFSFYFSILPVLLSKLTFNNTRLILAPRGEFSPGALSLKSEKKKLFIFITRLINLYKDIIFHATSIDEEKNITTFFNNKIIVANNLTREVNSMEFNKIISKKKNELKVIFLSRIHPSKNLKFALEILSQSDKQIVFNIHGPIEDKAYWDSCKKIIDIMPDNIKVKYHGLTPAEDVGNEFSKNHLFLFPTLGENFGHVISESLLSGTPVLISDNTPWNTLSEYDAGFSVSLKDSHKFLDVINYFADMDEDMYRDKSLTAFNYGIKKADSSKIMNSYIELFNMS